MRVRRVASVFVAVILAGSLVAVPGVSAAPHGTNVTPIGFHDAWGDPIESADQCAAAGWAVDPDKIDKAVNVRILSDGEQVWMGRAHGNRPDVKEAGYGNGHSGFDVSLVGLVVNGVPHEIRAQAQDLQTGEWTDLEGTPKTLTCPNHLPTGTHDGSEAIDASPTQCYANGWAIDPDMPDEDVTVRILSDDEVVWSGLADGFRQDLLDAGISDGTAAFWVNLSGMVSAGVAHVIRVQAQDLQTGQWQDLDHTPRTITCSPNHLLEGAHDGSPQVVARPVECYAAGWTIDRDAPDESVTVRILADGDEVWSGTGGQFKAGLVPHDMPDGAVAFFIDLSDKVSAGTPHEIRVQAQDIPTGAWVDLAGTPRTITCLRVPPADDIYLYTLRTGAIRNLTDTSEVGEYDPDWSPNGASLVVDDERYDGSGRLQHQLAIASVATGSSEIVPGSDGANNASWSPNGKWLVFDRYVQLEQYSPFGPCFACDATIYLLPVRGGTPDLLANDAMDPDWAPDSSHVAFWRAGSDTIWTVDLKGHERSLDVNGLQPAWSPDGRWIAYSWQGNLWKIRVDPAGRRKADPIQLTFGGFALNDFYPVWSRDGKTIYFNSHRAGVSAIWQMAAAGGEPTQLTHPALGTGDFAPSVSRDGKTIAYSHIVTFP